MAKDYLKEFGNPVRKFQAGGPAPEAAPGGAAPGGGGGGMQEALMQVIQSQDPNMALEFCNMLAQEMGIGGGAPGGAPAGGAPMGRNGMRVNTPVFKKGGKLA